MNTILVLSTGQTDVQLVVDGKRKELHRKNCGELHDIIQQRTDEWELVDAPIEKGEEVAELPDGPFRLCTPKLDAVLRYVGEDVSSIRVLILETRRRNRSEDPRFAGDVLARRLRERGVTKIRRCPYLNENDGDFSDSSNPKDAIIRCEVESRIDKAIRKSIAGSTEKAVVASTGGPSVITTLIDEVVRLHVGKECDLVEVEDGSRKKPPAEDRAVSRLTWEPHESFRARYRALELIENGNLLAAWGAVQHLDEDEVEHQWTQVIKWLADFAASLPVSEECNIDVLKHKKMAVRAAVRVELALRSEDIPRAVHGTVAFAESALWDSLRPHLRLYPQKEQNKAPSYYVCPEPAEDLIRKDSQASDPEDRKKPFERVKSEGATLYKVFDDNICAIKLAKYYLEKDSLTKLCQAVSEVRHLRNDVAHNEPTPELMEGASKEMEKKRLWSADNRFLTSKLVSNVLTELEVDRPDELCEDLIKTVQKGVRDAARHSR